MKSFYTFLENMNEDNGSQLKQEMKNYLKTKNKGLMDVNSPEFNFSMEAAIYWFAYGYHSGQWSDLYSILSTSEYKPSMLARNVNDEDEEVKMLYQDLVEKFKNK